MDSTEWAWQKRLKSHHKIVLVFLARHNTRELTIPISVIADTVWVSRKSVQVSLQFLASEGLISIVPNYGDDGGRRASTYKLNLEK